MEGHSIVKQMLRTLNTSIILFCLLDIPNNSGLLKINGDLTGVLADTCIFQDKLVEAVQLVNRFIHYHHTWHQYTTQDYQ